MKMKSLHALLACLAALCPQIVRAAEPAKTPIPVEAFALPSQFSLPRLSPDGQRLVITVRTLIDERYVPVMTVYNLADKSVASRIRLPAFELPIDYVWVSNTRLVVAKGREIGNREKPVATGEILAINFDGSKQDYLYGHDMYKQSSRGGTTADDYGHGFIHSLPVERNGRFFLREYKWARNDQSSLLLDVNASNATRRLVAEVPVTDMDFLLRRNGEPKFAFGDDEDNRYVLFEREDDKGSWRRVAIEEVGGRLIPYAYAPDEQSLIAHFSAKGEPGVLVRQTIASKERVVLASDPRGDIDLLQWTARPEVPFAAATSVGVPRPIYLEAGRPEAGLHQAIAAQFPGQYVNFLNFSDDGNRLVFAVTSDRDPGSYYLFDRAKLSAEFLFAATPMIDPERMAERRPIRFPARDGTELHGYLTLPKEHGEKKRAMVLLPHGGPHGVADEWFFDRDAQFLASRGYAVLQVNYRGSGGRGTAFRNAGYRQWGGLIQDDLIDGVRWATREGYADPERVCSVGTSFGAYSALMIAAREPGMFRCAVGFAGVYDLPLLYEEDDAKASKRLFNYYVKIVGQDQSQLAAFSPARQAERIRIPVLLVHGEQDKIASPEHAERMRKALIQSNNPPEWMMVPREGHGLYLVKNQVAYYQKVEAFLATHLPPGP